MEIPKCTHLRIRDNNLYGEDVETLVKYIEAQYGLDLRTVPQWKEIIKRFHVTTTDLRRITEDAKKRKREIIAKIYRQSTRPSPFQLTAMLARTAKRWEMLEAESRRKKSIFKVETDNTPHSSLSERSLTEESDRESGHVNTEVSVHQELVAKSEPEIEAQAPVIQSHLPVVIITNPHKLLGPNSTSYLSYKSRATHAIPSTVTGEDNQEWIMLPESTLARSVPKEIIVSDDSLEEQVIKFSILNCGSEYIHIKFICVTDKTPFRYVKIIPKTPSKLYPGLSQVYKLIFRVAQNEIDFISCLFFKVGQIVLAEGTTLQSLRIPVKSDYLNLRNVSVTEVVNVPSRYPWHLGGDFGYSTSYIKVSILDNFSYYVHINNKIIDFGDEPKSTSSLEEVMVSGTVITPSGPPNKSQIKNVKSILDVPDVELIDTVSIVSPIVTDIIDTSLDPFLIEQTCLHLKSHSNYKIPIHLTKVERTGSHHACYNVNFYDSESDKCMFTKTVKVYGQILANPIRIHPVILDMTHSPVSQGVCEDTFVIENSHKLYPVTVKIKLTTKMKKLIHIYPMEVVIPTTSNVTFTVRFCSPGLLDPRVIEYLVHFTFKITVVGHKSIYRNIPPFFYEIIAPCLPEYEKVYKKIAEAKVAKKKH